MKPSAEVIPRRMAEAKAAAEVFGAELFQLDIMESIYTDSKGQVVPLDYPRKGHDSEDAPPGGLPFSSAAWGYYREPNGKSAIDIVADILIKVAPELVVGNCVTQNPDHYAAALIVRQAYVKASKTVTMGPFCIGTHNHTGDIDFFPGEPEMIVDVTGFEEIAIKAFSCHRTQGCHCPKRIESRYARWHTWGKKINTTSAEPFRRIL
ncbi:MAG: hypothetical protein PHW60_12480 [Kiritimatiellae bacterium]|nr:hypothetical protein [Kiritimatiellia bacterium]